MSAAEPRAAWSTYRDIITMQWGLCPGMRTLLTASHGAVCGILTHVAAEPRPSAFGGVSNHETGRHPASTVCVSTKQAEAQETKTNPPFPKDYLVWQAWLNGDYLA